MPKIGVKGFSPVIIMVPRHRVVVAHFAIFVRFFVDFDQDIHRFIKILEIVELVFDSPAVGKAEHRRMAPIHGKRFARLHIWVAGVRRKLGTGQLSVPGPVIFGIGCRVNTDVPTTRLDISLKINLLRVVQHIAGSAQEDNGTILLQVSFSESGGIFCGVDRKSVLLTEVHQGTLPRWNRLVAEPFCARKNEYSLRRDCLSLYRVRKRNGGY